MRGGIMANVAQYVVSTLEANNVERVWGIAGDSLNGFTDALYDSPIEWMNVRHEEGGAFAAAAEAEVTGNLAVAAGSCGPGNLHLINGLYDAQRSRVPVLAIAAHIPSDEVGTGYFQETHPTDVFRERSEERRVGKECRSGWSADREEDNDRIQEDDVV